MDEPRWGVKKRGDTAAARWGRRGSQSYPAMSPGASMSWHSLRNLAFFTDHLENVFQGQLQHAVAALAGHQAEGSARGVRVRAAPVRVVEDVVHLEAELQDLALPGREVLAHRSVELPGTGLAQRLARLEAERAGVGHPKGRLVDPAGGIREGADRDI